MARTREPEIEFDPRHRIVGAIVLVTLAVILLPLILDEHPNSTIASTSSGTPEPEVQSVKLADNSTSGAEKVVVKKLTLDKSTTGTRLSEPTPDSKLSDSNKPVAQTRVATKKVETATSKPVAPVTESKPVQVAESHSSKIASQAHWAVQVGTFSNQANVRRLKKQLEQHGFAVMFKDIKLKQGNAVRVRVGPYASRASADKAQDKIKQDIGIKGVVVAGP